MMAVSLYTSRVVLNTLGVEDFGIYNVIGGVVAMFSVISGGLSAAISRYITFELGQGNTAKLKSVFSSSVTIQIGLALLIFVLAEIGGVWFLNEKMNLPESRIGAANWVLQCSILTFMVNLISVPYNAAIIAHERMQAFAYISIIEVVLKLLIVYILVIFSFDKLKLYGILLLAVACVIRIAYGIYCKRNFKECTYHFTFNKALLKEMMGFAGWNFIGAFAGVLRDQGVNIVINLFCGPVINAARAIAFQVNVAVNGFATKYIFAMCRFVPEKNLHHLIEAFSRTEHRECKLVIAGDSDFEDDYSASLKKYAREQGVVLPGFIKGRKLHALLSHARCFVLPSSHEGLPIALLEAMSYRLPVIVSDIPANLEVGLGQEFYFPLGDRRALARKLQENMDAPYRQIEYPMEKYDWNAIAERTASVYTKYAKPGK